MSKASFTPGPWAVTEDGRAGPDMYEALLAAKVVIGMMERPGGMGDEVNAALDKRIAQIDAALSKAEGRS